MAYEDCLTPKEPPSEKLNKNVLERLAISKSHKRVNRELKVKMMTNSNLFEKDQDLKEEISSG